MRFYLRSPVGAMDLIFFIKFPFHDFSFSLGWEQGGHCLVNPFPRETRFLLNSLTIAVSVKERGGFGRTHERIFTLILQHIHSSQFFCGLENYKFLSFQSKCLEDDDYFLAGTVIAMSIVHGGPAPQFLSPLMFDALVYDLSKVVVPVQEVMMLNCSHPFKHS